MDTIHHAPYTNGEPGTDSALLQMGGELSRLIDDINADRLPEGAEGPDKAMDRKADLEKRIAATPANTFAGMVIKLRIATDDMGPKGPEYGDELNLVSVLADAERLAGEGVRVPKYERPEDETGDPFEALAREWAACNAVHEAVANLPAKEAEPFKAVYERLSDIERRIAETPTTTLLGVSTKLRLEVRNETDYEFFTTGPALKTALAGAEHLIAALEPGAGGDGRDKAGMTI